MSGEQGVWLHTAGLWYADEADKGIQTSPDARFHNAWSTMDNTFSSEGKDLVLQVRTQLHCSLMDMDVFLTNKHLFPSVPSEK